MPLQSMPLSSEEQLRLHARLLDSVDQAILVIDLTGRIVLWNRFAEMLYGWTAVEAQNRSIVDILAAPLLMEAIQANLDLLRRGEVWAGGFLVQPREGTAFMVHVDISLIQIEQLTLISVVSFSGYSVEHRQLQEANQLLAEVGARLSDAVDYETPLNTLAQLAVPQLADWCAVHMLRVDGTIEQVALAPSGMEKLQAAKDWLQNHLPNDNTDGLPAVLRSGVPKLVSDVDSDLWAAAAAIRSYMIVPLIARPQTFGAVTFVTAESGRRFDMSALAVAENLASHIAIYLDKARLYQESQRLNAELEQRVAERTAELRTMVARLSESESTVQTLFRISKKLNATLDVETILNELALEAIYIVNGESGFAGLCIAGGMTVHKFFRLGVSIPFEYVWKAGQGIPGWVLEHKAPYGTSDAAHDPLFQNDLVINVGVRSIICTPILDSTGEVLGFFDIRNKLDGEGFTISDQEMLMALAPSASIAIQNGLAYQKQVAAESELQESFDRLRALAANLETVREDERTHVALELHDQLGQALTAMKFDLAWLAQRLGSTDTTLSHKTKGLTAQMDTMIKTVRRIATELRPGMLDDLGLAASIEWQARDFEKRTGIVCAVDLPLEAVSLDRTPSITLFRIFQEALTNVARHANAQYIEVKLFATDEAVTLEVHDDGRGIKSNEIAGKHSLGLLGMRERAKRLGGTFDIRGIPDDGTLLVVSVPRGISE